jgi:curved DNA-binding protein CbpA
MDSTHTADSLNLYTVLGVRPGASDEDIRQAYIDLAMRYHPDKNRDKNTTPQFQALNHAYQTLSDPYKRRQYDASTLRTRPTPPKPKPVPVSKPARMGRQPWYEDATKAGLSAKVYWRMLRALGLESGKVPDYHKGGTTRRSRKTHLARKSRKTRSRR